MPMKRTTRMLSGPRLARFFERFFQRQPGLDPEQAKRLAKISARTVSAAEVRVVALQALKPSHLHAKSHHEAAPPQQNSTATSSAPEPAGNMPSPASAAAPTAKTTASTTATGDAAKGSATPPAFDPYVFGLVPVYQRQGPDGLLARLGEIGHVENLRKMARAQQIVLPLELRSGEADVKAVRAGIVAAVGKRIADRRAAAG